MTNSSYILIPDSLAVPVTLLVAAILWLVILQPLWRPVIVSIRHRINRRRREARANLTRTHKH